MFTGSIRLFKRKHKEKLMSVSIRLGIIALLNIFILGF